MSYTIEIAEEAQRQLDALPVWEQRIVERGVLSRLRDRPTAESRAIRKLRPNPLAQCELRLGDLLVLYNVDDAGCEVVLLIVGRKAGNALIVGGKEYHAHQADTAEPT